MKKVLILTASTGQGHNQAAVSLKNEFSKCNYEVEIFDFLKGCSNILNKLITTGYEFSATKTPKLYGLCYFATNLKSINKILKFPFCFIDKKIANYITSSKADVIIGTHPFAVNIISRLKEKNMIHIPFISIVTDFKAHGAYISDSVDYYITGSKYTNEDLISKGIDKSRVLDYGIPIRTAFSSIDPEISSHDTGGYFNILLMSGSMGLNKMSKFIHELTLNERKLRLIIICGKNEKLKKRLEKEYSKPIKNKKIHIIGYCNIVSEIMDLADIIVTKPGGLTSTEAIYKKLPILIPFVIPGQETENADILVQKKCAIKINKVSEINNIINYLIDNKNEIQNIKNNLSLLSKNYSIHKIVKLCNDILKDKNS